MRPSRSTGSAPTSVRGMKAASGDALANEAPHLSERRPDRRDTLRARPRLQTLRARLQPVFAFVVGYPRRRRARLPPECENAAPIAHATVPGFRQSPCPGSLVPLTARNRGHSS
jgi:hypothetical protein